MSDKIEAKLQFNISLIKFPKSASLTIWLFSWMIITMFALANNTLDSSKYSALLYLRCVFMWFHILCFGKERSKDNTGQIDSTNGLSSDRIHLVLCSLDNHWHPDNHHRYRPNQETTWVSNSLSFARNYTQTPLNSILSCRETFNLFFQFFTW